LLALVGLALMWLDPDVESPVHQFGGLALLAGSMGVAVIVGVRLLMLLLTNRFAVPSVAQTVLREALRMKLVVLFVVLTILIIAGANIEAGGPAMGPGTPTSAPQAQALQAVITGMQGDEMPFALYGFGAALGLLLGLGSFAGLGVLVGLSMYLPFQYITTYGIGCVIQIIVAKIFGKSKAEAWGVPFCAGLIVGEALLALVITIYVLVPKG